MKRYYLHNEGIESKFPYFFSFLSSLVLVSVFTIKFYDPYPFDLFYEIGFFVFSFLLIAIFMSIQVILINLIFGKRYIELKK